MERSKIDLIADKVFWGIIYILPIVCLCMLFWQNPASASISIVMQNLGLGIVNDNVILTALQNLIGSNGYIPVFTSNDFLIYLTYYFFVMTAHFIVDLLFILIKWAHNLLDKVVK